MVLEPRHDFLLVPDANGAAGLGLEAAVARKVEIWEGLATAERVAFTGGQALETHQLSN